MSWPATFDRGPVCPHPVIRHRQVADCRSAGLLADAQPSVSRDEKPFISTSDCSQSLSTTSTLPAL